MEKHKITRDFNRKDDIYYVNFGEVEESVELFNGKLVLDFDTKGNVVGFEIFDFLEELSKVPEWVESKNVLS